ncbi:MAG TPA: protein kinase [Anaeromyxobacteraceae bacterium]|nr:protein kinase [Anaeromyxobacteraceae bacterium]
MPERTPLSELVARLVAAPPVPLSGGWTGALRPGARLGPFEIVGELGRGGFGVVYEARDPRLGRNVAIKVVRPGAREDADRRGEWLAREAEAAARLDHPNIVTVHDVGAAESGPYIVMERLHGETLRERLDRGPVPPADAVRIVREVARGVAHAHAGGVVHRDLKPGNVFLRRDGGVKVLDFGLARMLGGGGPPSGGTAPYIAPEQAAGGDGDARSDVHALGVMLDELHGPGGARGALARVAARARSADPERRHRDAAEFAADLERASPGRRRRAGALAAGATALLLVGAAAAWLAVRGGGGDRRIVVAVADAAGAAEDPELAGLSGMLATSLAQSQRLAVLPRNRLLDGLAAAAPGGAAPDRLDPDAVRAAAPRLGADVVIAPRVRPDGEGVLLEVRGIGVPDGATLFTLAERAPARGDVPSALDRLSGATRMALHEREADVRGTDIRLADAVTSSLAAYQHYAASQECMYRTSFGQDCAEPLRKALAADPTFALAHYQLAVWAAHHGGTREEQRVATRAAARHVSRVPPKERLLIRAWVAHFEGRDEEALALLERLVAENPGDEEGIYEAGDLLFHRSEFDRAAPWFERQLDLDPALAHGWGLEHLAHSLGALGRRDDLARLADGWTRAPASAANLHALVTARAWLGDLPGAEAAARREAEAGGGLSALEDQAYVAILAGRYDAVREALGPLVEPGSPAPAFGRLALAALDAYQGRRAAGRARLLSMPAELGPAGDDALVRGMRIQYLAGDGDSPALRAEVEALAAIDPEAAAVHAPLLAWLGDLEGAARLAPHLRPGSPRQRTHEAVVLWRSGQQQEALRRLRALARTSPYDVDFGLAPAWLLGDLSARSGDDAGAVDALRRFRALFVPTAMWRSWAHPAGLVTEAEALARLGRDGEAREALARFDREWSTAEPGQPLAARASALAARLGTGPGAGEGG